MLRSSWPRVIGSFSKFRCQNMATNMLRYFT
jgi:hypothetical protein